ncbi:MAG: DUF4149 domain-containing protein [Acidobacteriales bacterium]|nr:DUF4149 domain-containing protein [Terriglobales bacterium]
MSFLRYLMLLALIAWIGGISFFSFVLAPTVFGVLPTRQLAGNVVSRSLTSLHWMGMVAGLVFLAASLAHSRLAIGRTQAFAPRNILVALMLLLTAVSQFEVTPKMATLRSAMGIIDNVPLSDPARLQFDALHVWSTRLEGGVFLLGLVLAYLVARRMDAAEVA